MAPETPASAWYRGDLSIVSGGNIIAEDLCHDHATQLETSAEYLWDGNHDFPPYEEEVEVDNIVICEGCGLDDTMELELEHCFAEVEDSAVCDAEEFGVDLNGDDYYNICFGEEEACCFAAEDEVEDFAYYY